MITLLGAATSVVVGAFAAVGTGTQRTKARLLTAGASLETAKKSRPSSKPGVPLGPGLEGIEQLIAPAAPVASLSAAFRVCVGAERE